MKKGFYAFVILAVVFAVVAVVLNEPWSSYLAVALGCAAIFSRREKIPEIKITKKNPYELPVPNLHLAIVQGNVAVVKKIEDMLKILEEGTGKGHLDLHQGFYLFDKDGIMQGKIHGGNTPDVKLEMFSNGHAYALLAHIRPFTFSGEIAFNDGYHTAYSIRQNESKECRHALFYLPKVQS